MDYINSDKDSDLLSLEEVISDDRFVGMNAEDQTTVLNRYYDSLKNRVPDAEHDRKDIIDIMRMAKATHDTPAVQRSLLNHAIDYRYDAFNIKRKARHGEISREDANNRLTARQEVFESQQKAYDEDIAKLGKSEEESPLLETVAKSLGNDAYLQKLSGNDPGFLQKAKAWVDKTVSSSPQSRGHGSSALDESGGDLDKAIEQMDREIAANQATLEKYKQDYEKASHSEYGGGVTVAEAGVTASGKLVETLTKQRQRLTDIRDEFEKAGYSKEDRARMIGDAVKRTAWTEKSTDNIRKLSSGELVINPGSIFGQYDALVSEIRNSDASDVMKAHAIDRLDRMRETATEILKKTKEQENTRSWLGLLNAQSALAGLAGRQSFVQFLMEHKGLDDAQKLDEWVKQNKDKSFIWKSKDVVDSILSHGAMGIGKTVVGAGAGLMAASGIDPAAKFLGEGQQALSGAIEGQEEAGKLRGITGMSKFAVDTGSSALQMAPMFVHPAAVPIWGSMQGYESKLDDAVKISEQQLGRKLTPDELVKRYQEPEVQLSAAANGIQNAALSHVFKGGTEALALKGTVGNLTIRDVFSKAGWRFLKSNGFKSELKEFGKQIGRDFTDEAVEEFLNQLIDSGISSYGLGADIKFSDAIEEALRAGLMGGFTGAAFGQARSDGLKTKFVGDFQKTALSGLKGAEDFDGSLSDFANKGGMEAIRSGEFRDNIRKQAKTIWPTATDEEIDGFVRQVANDATSTAVASSLSGRASDAKMSDVIHSALLSGPMGGRVNPSPPKTQSEAVNQPPPLPASATVKESLTAQGGHRGESSAELPGTVEFPKSDGQAATEDSSVAQSQRPAGEISEAGGTPALPGAAPKVFEPTHDKTTEELKEIADAGHMKVLEEQRIQREEEEAKNNGAEINGNRGGISDNPERTLSEGVGNIQPENEGDKSKGGQPTLHERVEALRHGERLDARGLSEHERETLRSEFGDAIRFDADNIVRHHEDSSGDNHESGNTTTTRERLRERARETAAKGRNEVRRHRPGHDASVQSPGSFGSAEFTASTAAVATGRKLLYHEQWGSEAKDAAKIIRKSLPLNVEVMEKDGHVYAWRPDLLKLSPEEIHQKSLDGDNGRLLGYGGNMFEGESSSVRFQNKEGETIGGFYAPKATAMHYAEARAKDFEHAHGERPRVFIDGKEHRIQNQEARGEGATPPPSERKASRQREEHRTKAATAAHRVVEKFRKNPVLHDAISVTQGIRAVTHDGKIYIDPDLIISESIDEGMDGRHAFEYFKRILNEEVCHYAHLKAARRLWEEKGRPGKDFETWRNEYYGETWKQAFSEEERQAAKKLYGDAFEELADWQKAMEAIRMLHSGKRISEEGRLWSADITARLKEILEAALHVMREMARGLDPRSEIHAEIKRINAVLAEIKAAQESAPEAKTEPTEQPPINKPVQKEKRLSPAKEKLRDAFSGLVDGLNAAPLGGDKPQSANDVKLMDAIHAAKNETAKASAEFARQVGNAWLKIGQRSDAHRLGKRLTGKTLEHIKNQLPVSLSDNIRIRNAGEFPFDVESLRLVDPDLSAGKKVRQYRIDTPQGFALMMRYGNKVWGDTSRVQKGGKMQREKAGFGPALYQMILSYAHNNGLTLVPDPMGSSRLGQIRRWAHLLSSVTRFSESKHLDPKIDGIHSVPGWTHGKDTAQDAGRIALAEYEYVKQWFPEIEHLRLNKDFNKVISDARGNDTGKGTETDVRTALENLFATGRDPRVTGIGEATLRRALVTRMATLGQYPSNKLAYEGLEHGHRGSLQRGDSRGERDFGPLFESRAGDFKLEKNAATGSLYAAPLDVTAGEAPVYTKGLPRERRNAFLDAVDALLDEGISTPKALAETLDEIGGGKLRAYSEAVWSFFRVIDPSLPANVDWHSLYEGKNAAPHIGGPHISDAPHISDSSSEALGTEERGEEIDTPAEAAQEKKEADATPQALRGTETLDSLKEKGKQWAQEAKPYLEQGEKQIEDSGPNSIGADPAFANPGMTPEARGKADVVRALDSHRRMERKDADTHAKGREWFEKHPEEVEELLYRAAHGDAAMRIDDWQQHAINLMLDKKAEEVGSDSEKLEELYVLYNANILSGREQARAFRQRMDRFATPAQRAQSALKEAIFRPEKGIEARTEGMTLEQKKACLASSGAERISRLEKLLAKFGLRVDRIIGKNRSLRLANSAMLKQALDGVSELDGKIIRMVQKGATLSEVRSRYGSEAAQRTGSLVAKVRRELGAKLREMLKSGMTYDQIMSQAKQDGLKAAPLSGGDKPSNNAIEDMVNRLLTEGFGLPEKLAKNPTEKRSRAGKKSRVKLSAEELAAAQEKAAQRVAESWVSRFTKAQSDTPNLEKKKARKRHAIEQLVRAQMKEPFEDFQEKITELGATPGQAWLLDAEIAKERENVEIVKANRKLARKPKEKAEPTEEELRKKEEEAIQRTAQRWVERLAETQSDTPKAQKEKRQANAMEALIGEHIKTELPDFIERATEIGATPEQARILEAEAKRERVSSAQIRDNRAAQRKTEYEANTAQRITESWIEKYAKSQSDTPSFRKKGELHGLELLIREHVKNAVPGFKEQAMELGMTEAQADVLNSEIERERANAERIREAREAQERAEREAGAAQRIAQSWIEKYAKSQSDTPDFAKKKEVHPLESLIREHAKNAVPGFRKRAMELGMTEVQAEVLGAEMARERKIAAEVSAEKWLALLENGKPPKKEGKPTDLQALNALVSKHINVEDGNFIQKATELGVSEEWAKFLDRKAADERERKRRESLDRVVEKWTRLLAGNAPQKKERKFSETGALNALIARHVKSEVRDFVKKAMELGATEEQANFLSEQAAIERDAIQWLKKGMNANPLSAKWSGPVFSDGMKHYAFDTKDRVQVMKLAETIRGLAGALGKIESLEGEKLERAQAALREIDGILEKYGVGARDIFEKGLGVDSYGFDPEDVVQIAAVTRIVNSMDADVVDKASEVLFNNMLSGLQTMAVNATAIAPAAWDYTVGRGFEAAINFFVNEPLAAQAGETKYIVKAVRPALERAFFNALATWQAQHPMFDLDVNAMDIDWERILGGGSHAAIGSISGTKGDIVRVPMRILMATDDFNRTLLACSEVGAFAYRLAKMQGMKEDTKEFDDFMSEQVNTPGSLSFRLASEKASRAIFSNPLPGQYNPYTGEEVPIEGIGDMVGYAASKVTEVFNYLDQKNIAVKALSALLKISFFPFQRTPFNVLRAGVRHILNPISIADILIGTAINARVGGKWQWKIEGTGKEALKRHRQRAELITRSSQQLQGALLMALLYGMAAGDDDDQDKHVLVTGSQPFFRGDIAQREARMRSGIGPYQISIRLSNGKRFTINYGRIEYFATAIAGTVDILGSVKRAQRSGKGLGGVPVEVLGRMVSQAKDKTFLRGIGDTVELLQNVAEGDDKALQKFLAGRLAIVIPNLSRQPLREMDPYYRERSNSFMQELLYQAFPYGQKTEKIDPYGQAATKTGLAPLRIVDVFDMGTQKVHPVDEMLLRWADKHPGEKWFPSIIHKDSYKDNRTGEKKEMTPEQLREFKIDTGARLEKLLAEKDINYKNPTVSDVATVQKLTTKARREAKEALAEKLTGPKPPKPSAGRAASGSRSGFGTFGSFESSFGKGFGEL